MVTCNANYCPADNVARLQFSGHQCVADRLGLGFVLSLVSVRHGHCHTHRDPIKLEGYEGRKFA